MKRNWIFRGKKKKKKKKKSSLGRNDSDTRLLFFFKTLFKRTGCPSSLEGSRQGAYGMQLKINERKKRGGKRKLKLNLRKETTAAHSPVLSSSHVNR